MNNMQQAALHYASMGLRVFPVVRGSKGSTINGRSGQLLKSWKDEATTDPQTIEQWWNTWQDADVCIATGNGLLVIDLDVKGNEDGTKELLEWCSRNGTMPPTAVVKTKSGGQHHYYFVQGVHQNSRGLYPGIDIRSDGGYVVAPPSEGYCWTTQHPIAQADKTVYDFLQKKEQAQSFVLPQEIPEGGRNDTLFKFAASLQAKGVPDEVIMSELNRVNMEKCQPPLDDKDVEIIFNSVIGRYQKGKGQSPCFPDVKLLENGSMRVLVTADNTKAILDYEGYEVYYDVILRRTVIKKKGESAPGLPDINYEDMLTHITDQYTRLGARAGNSRIHEHISQIARKNRFNAAKNYLEINHIIWAGTGGIKELLLTLQVKDVQDPMYETLITKWLCQCVAMAHNDKGLYGADGVLVLSGPQGIGKTTFFRKCCVIGAEYFTEGAFYDGSRDKTAENTSAWITELGELPRSMKDTDSMKAFITNPMDKYRVPYDRKESLHPRFTSFGATTNEEKFLKDDSNRRYWIVELTDINLKQLNEVRFEKVWSEAYELFMKKGTESFRLTAEERKTLESRNGCYRIESEEERLLLDVFDWEQPQEEWKEYTATQIAEIIGHNVSARRVGKALRSQHFSGVSHRLLDGIIRYKMPRRGTTLF